MPFSFSKNRRNRHYLLGAPLIYNFRLVLGLVSVLPREVDEELARPLVVAGLDRLYLILPRANRRLPRPSVGGRRCRGWVAAVAPSFRSVRRCACRRSRRRPSRRPASLLGLERRLGGFKNLVSAAHARQILAEDFGRILSVSPPPCQKPLPFFYRLVKSQMA